MICCREAFLSSLEILGYSSVDFILEFEQIRLLGSCYRMYCDRSLMRYVTQLSLERGLKDCLIALSNNYGVARFFLLFLFRWIPFVLVWELGDHVSLMEKNLQRFLW